MLTTWTIAVDWDRNGNFTGTDDDITSRVIEATCCCTMSSPVQGRLKLLSAWNRP